MQIPAALSSAPVTQQWAADAREVQLLYRQHL